MKNIFSKDGQEFFEVEPDIDTSTGIDKSVQTAAAKGYKQYLDVTKDGKEIHTIPAEEMKQARAKGYEDKRIIDTQEAVKNNKYSSAQTIGKIGYGETALRGATQGATHNFADEALAGVQSAISPTTYEEALASTRARDAAAREQNPKTYMASDVAGSLVTPDPTGKLKGVAKLGGLAASGAVSGLGASENKSLNDAGVGAGLGLAGAAVAKGAEALVGKGARALTSEAASEAAGNQAAKATGALKRDAGAVLDKYGTQANFGRELLDNGLVKAGDTAESIGKKSVELAKKSGEDIGVKLSQYEAEGVRVPLNLFKKNVLDNVTAKLEEPGTPVALKNVAGDIKGEVQNIMGDFKDRGGWITPAEASGIKSKLYDLVYRNQKTPNLADTERRKMAHELMTVVDDAIGSKLGDAEKASFQGAKKQYGLATTAAGIGEDAAERAFANRSVSPSTYIAGAAGAAAGSEPASSGLISMAAAAANHLGLKYGNAAAAAGFDKLSKVLATTPGKLPSQALKLLEEASKKGNSSLAATHLMLMQRSPEYKDAIEQQ